MVEMVTEEDAELESAADGKNEETSGKPDSSSILNGKFVLFPLVLIYVISVQLYTCSVYFMVSLGTCGMSHVKLVLVNI